MAYSATVTVDPLVDFTARHFIVAASVAVVTGTYPSGGIGPLGLAAAAGIGVQSAVPKKSFQNSVGNPPVGIIYEYDPTTDKLRAFVTGTASGDVLNELSGTIPGDTIQIQQWFSRGQ
jgi:hypothetical protein